MANMKRKYKQSMKYISKTKTKVANTTVHDHVKTYTLESNEGRKAMYKL